MSRRCALEPVVLGPISLGTQVVRLRPTRVGDFAQWRRLRLRDEALIAPYWESSPLSWEERHTEALWVRELADQRVAARQGRCVHFAIDVDGRLVGQTALTGIDVARHSAEAGIWVERARGRARVGRLAMAMLLDYGTEVVGLRRITGPCSTANRPAALAARAVGMELEARMVGARDVDGHDHDHDLWVLHRGPTPPALVRRVLGPGAAMTVTPVRTGPVLPVSATGATAIARRGAGRLRTRVLGPPTRSVPEVDDDADPVRLCDVHGHVARLRVELSDRDPGADARDDEAVGVAVDDLLRRAFSTPGIRRVWAEAPVGDLRLIELLRRAGLRHEGTLLDHRAADGQIGDHELWAVTSADREPVTPW